jgi:hypothetical protein
MIQALAPYKLAAEIAVFGALAVGAVYGAHQFLEHERDIGRAEVRAEYEKQLAAAKEDAVKKERDWQARFNDAINQGAKNAQALQTAATAAAVSSSSLRDTIATLRERLPGASAEASRAYASTLATLFAECKDEYRAMGQAAQGHANDAATLGAAFPTEEKAK